MRAAGIAVLVWFVAALVVLVLTTADVSGFQLTTPGFSSVVLSFITQIDLGRALWVSIVLIAVVGSQIFRASRIATVAAAAVLSLIALLPLALAGHSAGSRTT